MRPLPPAGVRPPAGSSAWGSDDDAEIVAPVPAAGAQQVQVQHRGPPTPASTSGRTGQRAQQARAAPPGAQQHRERIKLASKSLPLASAVPSLQALALGCIGRHLEAFVHEAGDHLVWLPPDAKAALLAVARRRGLLYSSRRAVSSTQRAAGVHSAACPLLAALVDETWQQLDLAGCSRLSAVALLEAAEHLPQLQVVDLTGCSSMAAGCYKRLACKCPKLQVLRVGGSPECNEAVTTALPRILPRIAPLPRAAAAATAAATVAAEGQGRGTAAAEGPGDGTLEASWEDAVCDASATAAEPGRLHELQAIVWPDAPPAALELIASQCPKVAVNPKLRPDPRSGAPPARELDPKMPLDAPLMRLVGPEATAGLGLDGADALLQDGVEHISVRFRAAYVAQAERRRVREQQRWEQEQRRQWRSSAALRLAERWLDEE